VDRSVDVAALVRPVVEREGFEFVEASFAGGSGRRVLRVTVDRDGGVDLDALAEISERVSRRLDLEDLGPGAYRLEVSSPGIERALRTHRDYARAVGSLVQISTSAPVDDARSHRGTLLAATDDDVTVEVDGAPRTIALAQVASARTVADWAAELKGSRA
jgi:ribosome maturation factor RimP